MKKIIKRIIENTLSTLSPEFASKFWYYMCFNKRLDLKRPVTLNEKLMWLKLNDYWHNPVITMCADKYRVREFIKDNGCEGILNELYGVWDKAEDINWDKLPQSFVLKCNHGCGYNVLCPDKNKADESVVKKQLDEWMHTDFWKKRAEVQYQDIEKKIVCEVFLGNGESLADYKIYCFNGRAEYILYCDERETGNTKFYFFDRQWNMCPINKGSKDAFGKVFVEKPEKLQEMLDYAEKLAKPFPFVRVDFYYTENRIIFGELTFVPAAALDTARLPETDIMFGNMLDIDLKK